jgi:nicotinate-nucleotide adenylyltransferase
MNIAVFGGRFDPPHVGHLAVAREVLKQTPEIDEVWLMPANTHPWRPIIAPAFDRLQMVRLMQEDRIKGKDTDIARGGETYTIDSIKLLFQENRNNKYYWVCGIDQLKDFYRWKEYDELAKLIDFLVFPRKGYDEKTNLPKNFSLIKGDFFATDLASSTIRDRIKKGQSIAGFVTPKVEQYIKEKNLYI